MDQLRKYVVGRLYQAQEPIINRSWWSKDEDIYYGGTGSYHFCLKSYPYSPNMPNGVQGVVTMWCLSTRQGYSFIVTDREPYHLKEVDLNEDSAIVHSQTEK